MKRVKKKKGYGKKVYVKSGDKRLIVEKGKFVWIRVK